MIMSKMMMGQAKHIEGMEETKNSCNKKILVGRPEGRNHLEDLGLDGR
jgi:hypothetical protein